MDSKELQNVDGAAAPADVSDVGTPSLDAEQLAKTAGRVAASALLATSLTAALTEPPRADLITLPEPTPIVQVYNPYADDIEPAEEDEDDSESNRWRRILRIMKYLAVALLLAGSIALGLLKGCVGCSAGLLAPPDDPPQEEQEDEQNTSQQAAALIFA
ncbi:MAG: hypothetical protein IJ781_06545 [Atopobiaceae bacterium]|nr:hypothetical protein [Atopobiaceae bacterium]